MTSWSTGQCLVADQPWLQAADRIVAIAEGQPVRIGVFSPINLPETNFGPGCVEKLTAAIEDLQPGGVRADAGLEVSGNYTVARSRTAPELAGVLKVTIRIFDTEYNEELDSDTIKVEIDSTREIAGAAQTTVALSADGTKEQRNQPTGLGHSSTSRTRSLRTTGHPGRH